MKKAKQTMVRVKLFILVLLSSLAVTGSLDAQISSKIIRKYTDGRIFRELLPLSSVSYVDRVFYDNGRLRSEVTWQNGKRNGLTKVFGYSGALLKEIYFENNKIMVYKAYVNGVLYYEIPQDRKYFMHKGRKITPRWNKYYEVIGSNKIWMQTPDALLDNLSEYMQPEQATDIMAKLNSYFESKAGSVPGDDMLTCGGSTSIYNDRNINIAASDASLSPQQIADKRSVTQNVLSTCGQQIRQGANIGAGSSTSGFINERAVQNARTATDNMIASCESQSLHDKGMFAVDPSTIFKSLQVLEQVEAITASTAWDVGATVVDVVATDGYVAIVDAAPVTSQLGGFILTDVAVATAGTMVVGAAAFAVGMYVSDVIGGKINDALKDLQDPITNAAAESAAADEAARLAAERQAKNHKDAENGERAKAPESAPPPSTPLPPGLGDANTCQRMRNFKSYCDNTGWRDMRCLEYARTINKCAGNVTQMYVAGDGNVFDIGCPGNGDSAQMRLTQCKQKGMIAIPSTDGRSLCGNSKVGLISRDLYGQQGCTDPPRNDFRSVFANNTSVSVTTQAKAMSVMQSTTVNSMIILMNSDCPNCKSFSEVLNDPKSVAAFANSGIKGIVVEASDAPDLVDMLNVRHVPAYFMVRSGKRSVVQLGALNISELAGYLSASK